MKLFLRSGLLAIVLLLSLLMVSAQDAEETAEATNIFIQSAVSVNLTENIDGTYTLTLNRAPEFTPWLTPDVSVGSLSTDEMRRNWVDEGVDAILEAGRTTIYVTLTALDYSLEDGIVEYTATINAIESASPLEITELPDTLNNATLLIPADLDLALQLLIGRTFTGLNANSNLRNVSETDCSPSVVAALEALLPQASGEQAENIQMTLAECAALAD